MDNNKNSLKQQAVSGAKWIGTANIITTVLLFARLTVLGRILDPADFGLMSMIMVVINFAFVFSDIGISKAIIQRQNISGEQLSSLYWVNIFIGIAIMLIVAATAPLVAAFYHEERLASLIIVSSITFPITAVGQQFQVLLEKEMKFDKLASADILSSLIGTVITIICAIQGYGVISLVIGQITISAIKMLYTLAAGLKLHKPRLFFNIGNVKEFISFGLFQMGERCVDYLSGNVSSILIGRFLGPEILGMYYFAYQIVLMPITKINPILTRVAFPVFSKKQSDNQALNKGYIELNKLIAYIVIPLLTGLAVTAPVAIPLIFGNKWTGSIILIQIMALPGIFIALGNPIGTIQLAKGRADIGFYWNLLAFIMSMAVMLLVIRNGVIALAYSQIVLSIISFIAGLYIIRYLTEMSFSDYLAAIAKPGIFGFIMGMAVYLCYVVFKLMNMHEYAVLGILVLFGAIVYLLLAFLFDKDYCLDLWNSIIYKRGSR